MSKGVARFLRYNDDRLSDEQKVEISELLGDFRQKLADRQTPRKEFEPLAKKLDQKCHKAVSSARPSWLRENVEMFFVAIAIALAFKAYFYEMFTIPTGSMQPTLHGIIAYPTPDVNPLSEYNADEDYEKPNPVRRIWDGFWYGRTHVEWIAPEEVMVVDLEEKRRFFNMFPYTVATLSNGDTLSAPGTYSRVSDLLRTEVVARRGSFQEGETIARGYVDRGDKVIVNKWLYHWKPPARSDVFVFGTRGISGIQVNPAEGSQNYIKRLVGVPGDTLQLKPPLLYVDGDPADDFGIKRVGEAEGRYAPGYVLELRETPVKVESYDQRDTYRRSVVGKDNPPALHEPWDLGDGEYWAMGDNSDGSSDSRAFGPVPDKNIKGKGSLVAWPFGHNFGWIR